MKIKFVDLNRQYLTIKKEIDLSIQSVVQDSMFILGKEVEKFEESFANLIGTKYCISVANGTDSLFIIMKSLGIGVGDEVITVCNSWISSSETISLTGAKPIFVDIDRESCSMDVSKLEKLINEKTKAIMPVHLYGNPCNMDKVCEIASKYNLHIIEDCAQSHLAEYNNKLIGSFGIASSFSFFPGKNLGAYGDAGAIVTNNTEIANYCRMFARHGALKKHNHLIEGINSRMDNLQASILNVKIKYLKDWTSKRIEVAKKYDELLSKSNVRSLKTNKNGKSVYHLYVIECDKRDELKLFLEANGVSTAIHYPKIIPLQQAYKSYKYNKNDFPEGSYMQDRILSLPIFPEIKVNEINYIVELINKFYKK